MCARNLCWHNRGLERDRDLRQERVPRRQPYPRCAPQHSTSSVFSLTRGPYWADENVHTKCKSKVFGDTCPASCYDGYTPTDAATYECVDDSGKTTGKWQAPSTGPLVCTGISCASAPPQDASGNAVSHATSCASEPHYDRINAKKCDHGTGADEPCDLGYNYNDHLQDNKKWDECECSHKPLNHGAYARWH